jgi:hypothetical protein
VQALADEAMRRAQGWEDEQVQADGSVKRLFKYSDTMLIFMMKARDPDTYFPELKARYHRDRASDVSELLKAVLLELTERHTLQAPATEAEWAPVPPGERTANGTRPPLPAPPGIDDD